MPTVRDVLGDKEHMVHSVTPTPRVLDAIRQMNQHKICALLVMHEGRVVGIFTERDVLRRVVGEERQPGATNVEEVMTADVICVSPETDLDEVSAIMQQNRVRHLPVCDAHGELKGMVSIGDVNACHASTQQAHLHFLSEYIYGRA
jgi:CBS domain-containing protein